MGKCVPHIVQYQGSKRKLAPEILKYMPPHIKRLVEPFAGTAAVSIAAAYEHKAETFYLNDLNEPLINMLEEAVSSPEKLADEYEKVWNEQFSCGEDHVKHFYIVRDRFNSGEKTAANMLYLLARCVKGSVRYGSDGRFNQSPDRRRHGTKPENIRRSIMAVSELLKGRTEFSAFDYHEVFENVKPGDLVYMDPPYQGVSSSRDRRYLSGVSFEEFSKSLSILDSKGADYIISYDGSCGGREYGKELPLKKVMLNAGLSSQATLSGRKSVTYESLYISESLIPVLEAAQKI